MIILNTVAPKVMGAVLFWATELLKGGTAHFDFNLSLNGQFLSFV